MGLIREVIESIYREHLHRAIDGDVLLIGRQTIYNSPSEVLELISSFGIPSKLNYKEIQLVTDASKNMVNAFCINRDWLKDPKRHISSFTSPYEMATIVIAEKGAHSTSDQLPIQQHYRTEQQWTDYRAKLEAISNHSRHQLVRSHSPIFFKDVKAGHLFMNQQFDMIDPTDEILRTHVDLKKDY